MSGAQKRAPAGQVGTSSAMPFAAALLTAGLLAACAHSASGQPATARASLQPPRLFVSNEDSNDVSVLDADTGRLLQTIPVGKRPRGIRLSPDGQRVYVAVSGTPRGGPGVEREPSANDSDRSADGVVEIDAAAGRVLRTLRVGHDPESFDLTPDGRLLLVSNEDSSEASLVQLSNGEIIATFSTGPEPEGVEVRPDGRAAYVTNEGDGTITVVDPVGRKVVASFSAGDRPRSVAFTMDGRLAFITGEQSASVAVVDAQRHAVLQTLHLEGVNVKPMGLAMGPEDRMLYVSTGRGQSVVEIDVAARRVTRSFPAVGERPWGIAIRRDGSRLYTANGPSDDVSIVDTATGKVLQRAKAGRKPWGLALAE